jgi:Nuclease-related domain/UvrD-like helicase C-terminal domain
MARMIPATVSPETKSNAERSLFLILQNDLPGTWTVLHSLGIASHHRKPWAEIDFVLIGPMGVFCLEVKGGRIRRDAGAWIFINARGEESRKLESPFDQVGGAAAALYNFLRDSSVRYAGMVAQGVLFPDIVFRLDGPDIDQSIVYDVRDTKADFRQYLNRISVRSREKHHPAEAELTESRRSGVVNALRGDFDFRPSLQRRTETINEELLSLTTEQYRTLDMLVDNARVLIKGSAGTGKTMLAAEEARRGASLGRRVLLCCFSRNLAEFLADTLAAYPLIQVESFHRLMARLVREAGLQDLLPDASSAYLYEVAFPDLCFEAIATLSGFEPYDQLIVDEGQDLMLDRYWSIFDVLLLGGIASGNFRVFYDPKQNLFDGMDGSLAGLVAKSTFAKCELSLNCRNTEPTIVNGALLCGAPLGRAAKAAGPESIIEFWADSREQQQKITRLIRQLLSEKIRPEQITILSPRKRASSALSSSGLPCSLADITDGGRTVSGSLSFCTVAGFKGLESDVVLLIDVDGLQGAEYAPLLYVAVTRPRILLAAFLNENVRPAFEDNARKLGAALAEPFAG